MAIRFPRVLIACGLPTILAIVSYYWLRKRRKAVIDSSSPKLSLDSTSGQSTQYEEKKQSEEPSTTDYQSQYEMQLKESNSSATTGAVTGDQQSRRNGSEQTASNHSNHSSAVKRPMSCDNATNECNGNERQMNHIFSSKCEDNIVVKLSNFNINDKDIEVIETINNSINLESNCDNCVSGVDTQTGLTGAQLPTQSPASEPAVDTTVSSHTDSKDCNDSTTSISNPPNDESFCENNHHINDDTNDCQHIQVLERPKESAQHLSLGITTPDGLPMLSQTNSIDNASSVCSSSASLRITNGYDTGDMYQNYPDSVSNGVYSPPPHSTFSDVHSEGSSDSAKGGSDIVHTPVIDGPLLNPNEPVIYQFEIPQYLCGRLIGSGGRFVTQIKRTTNTSVVINKHPVSSDMKICTLTGTKPEINDALGIIRMRFPLPDYSHVTLDQINLLNASQTCPMPVQTVQLQLPSGIFCDVILSSLVSAGHFFLQQPTHPTYPSLSRLDHHMIQTYSQQTTPLLPTIHAGMICAVPIMGGWYRAVITKVYNTEECDVMFVDYGGFSRLPVSSLRQIRFDFMTLPFQASECYLANVEPIDPEIGWTGEANALFEELAQGQILQAFIVGYAENGIPLVNLFKVQGVSNVFINQELVNQSHAQWVDNSL